MRILVALLALVFASALQAQDNSRSIDAFIESELPASGAPGVAYAAIENGQVQTGARGEVLAGSGNLVTADTPFIIGSISKSFTAMAIMQLVEAGSVELDAAIARYLPQFAGRPPGEITVRQLLSHTSGYSTLQGNETHRDSADVPDELSMHVDRIARWEPAYGPEERWEYSNANYQLLGAIIEKVSGRDYAGYVEMNILAPIGMEDSFVADGETYENMARGHRPWFWTKRALEVGSTERITAPAGGVIASASDLALYMQVMMNGQDDVISAQGKAMMLRPASDASPFYGLGWFIDDGRETAWHSGSSPGVETLMTLKPAERKGVVVLVNGGSGIGFGENATLRNGVTARALDLEYAGEGSRLQQEALFLTMVLLPIVFSLSIWWAWRHRAEIHSKRQNAFGLFSLWFPLLTTAALAFALFYVFPMLFGTSLDSLLLFQPDMGFAMIATAVMGVLWAITRLALAYSGKSAPTAKAGTG